MDEQSFKERDVESYRSSAAEYHKYVQRLGGRLAVRICELARLQEGQRVLDTGTGSGLAAREAATRVAPSGSVLGIDLSPAMISVANELNAGLANIVDYRVMDAESLEFGPSSFDVVVSLCAVSHFPDVFAAAREWHRVLVPGGRLVVSSGCVRPLAGWPLTLHYAKQVARIGLQPIRPVLKAPHDLAKVVSSKAPLEEHVIGTSWSGHRPLESVLDAVRSAGFDHLETSWLVYDVRFYSAEEFWDAQVAVATAVRKRLQVHPGLVETLRADYLAMAQRVLDRHGMLVYPYGAFFVEGVRGESSPPS